MRSIYEPLRSNGMYLLVRELFDKAGVDFKGHDLRRAFSTLVKRKSNELLAMRLLRDRVQGVNDRYNEYLPEELVEALNEYSPLRQIHPTTNKEPGVPEKRVGDDAHNLWCRGGDLNSHALSNATP